VGTRDKVQDQVKHLNPKQDLTRADLHHGKTEGPQALQGTPTFIREKIRPSGRPLGNDIFMDFHIRLGPIELY